MSKAIDWLLHNFGFPTIVWVDDHWGGRDKGFHCALHFGIVFVGGFVLPWVAFGQTHWLLVLFAVLVSEFVGFVWEMYDSARGVGASWKDIVWNNIGLCLAVVIGIARHLVT